MSEANDIELDAEERALFEERAQRLRADDVPTWEELEARMTEPAPRSLTNVGIAATVFAARDMDLGIVVVSDACYSMRGDNNKFFMERVFPRMGHVMTVDEWVKLMGQ